MAYDGVLSSGSDLNLEVTRTIVCDCEYSMSMLPLFLINNFVVEMDNELSQSVKFAGIFKQLMNYHAKFVSFTDIVRPFALSVQNEENFCINNFY